MASFRIVPYCTKCYNIKLNIWPLVCRALRSFHLFSPLLKGDQFHVYLTAQTQNSVPIIFAFFNIPKLRKLEQTLESAITTGILLVAFRSTVIILEKKKFFPPGLLGLCNSKFYLQKKKFFRYYFPLVFAFHFF